MSRLFVVSGAVLLAFQVAARERIALDEWRFAKPGEEERVVTLPHTCNAVDGEKGEPYYRGAARYAKTIAVPEEWRGRRVFVRFGAAGQVARVCLDGLMLGEHKGAFSAFAFELTEHLKFGRANELRVETDNTLRLDVPPLSGDFNIDNGLYRDAELIVVNDAVCVSPLDFASSGVYVTPEVQESKAKVNVRAVLSNGESAAMPNKPEVKAREGLVRVTIGGKNAAKPYSLPPDSTQSVSVDLEIADPILWDGVNKAHLYTARVEVLDATGRVVDVVEQPFGIRTVAITEADGFLLNGRPYPVRGVGRHQDVKGKGWALDEADDARDIALIKGMGATAVRFAHYPQSERIHRMADEAGLLVWDEIPQVNAIRGERGYRETVREMLREMVMQLYNHPSVAWWGLFNEIENMYSTPSDDFLEELKATVRALDPTSRIVVGASDHGARSYNRIPERTAFNNYPGWYHGNWPKEEGNEGRLDQFGAWIEARATECGVRIGISEYGAGGDWRQHAPERSRKPKPAHGGKFQPEEYLAYVHEEDWRVLNNNTNLWGTFLWAFADFSSATRHEGSVPGVNTKGIVSHDRTVLKDPYFFYKANWTREPMVYIASRRSGVLPSAKEIVVYSNCPQVTLKVNGRIFATLSPDEVKVCRFENVPFANGANTIEAVADGASDRIEVEVWDADAI